MLAFHTTERIGSEIGALGKLGGEAARLHSADQLGSTTARSHTGRRLRGRRVCSLIQMAFD